MLGWLFRRPSSAFVYHDGCRKRTADPMALIGEFIRALPLIQSIKNSRATSLDETLQQGDEAIALLRSIFDIPAVEDGGLPWLEVAQLGVEFQRHIRGLSPQLFDVRAS